MFRALRRLFGIPDSTGYSQSNFELSVLPIPPAIGTQRGRTPSRVRSSKKKTSPRSSATNIPIHHEEYIPTALYVPDATPVAYESSAAPAESFTGGGGDFGGGGASSSYDSSSSSYDSGGGGGGGCD